MEHRLSTGPHEEMTIDQLSQQIIQVQDVMQVQATHAINLSLTARNCLIGHHIVEYEQCGKDRAQYGTQLLNNLATKINRHGLNARRLREFRLFYSRYPQLGPVIISFIGKLVQGNNDIASFEIWRSSTAKLQKVENQENGIWRLPTAELEQYQTSPDKLFQRLNFTSLLYLSSIDDDIKRAFYEQEAIAGCWTVKELDRQVSSLYFERMGLSKDKLALRKFAETGSEVMQPDDNPPIGLLLCTDYGETTVKYATEGMSQNLFVSKYRLQLPSEDEIRNYLMENIDRNEFLNNQRL